MKYLSIIIFAFLYVLNCKADSTTSIKEIINSEIKEYISFTQKKPFNFPPYGMNLIYVVVINECDNSINFSINNDSREVSIPYIAPNYTFIVNGKTIFVRTINLSEELIQQLQLEKYDSAKNYSEMLNLQSNSNKMVNGINESFYIEINDGIVTTKRIIPAVEIEGDLWIYGSEYTKKEHGKYYK
jgi:hypothetical protein